jgi:hypothetical protein
VVAKPLFFAGGDATSAAAELMAVAAGGGTNGEAGAGTDGWVAAVVDIGRVAVADSLLVPATTVAAVGLVPKASVEATWVMVVADSTPKIPATERGMAMPSKA